MRFAKMMLAVLSLFAVVGTSACSKEKSETIQVTDMLGEKVEIKKNPKKVACVSRTTYDLLIAFGLGDKIDGAYDGIYTNPWTEVIYPQSKDEYQYNYNESYETFIARGVDVVFAPEKYIADGLKEHGICALNVSLYGTPSFDNYVTFFADLVTQMWDYEFVKEKAESWKAKVLKAIQDVKVDNVTQKVFYVRGDKNKGIGYTDNLGSFTEYAYRSMGYDFVGSKISTNKPSSEEIMLQNPDIFVVGGVYQNTLIDLLKTSEPYKNLDAVKNNKIYNIPIGLTMFEQLSAMTPVFFYDQSNKLNGTNYDVKEMTKETIREYFGTEMSDQDIDNMFAGKDAKGNNLA